MKKRLSGPRRFVRFLWTAPALAACTTLTPIETAPLTTEANVSALFDKVVEDPALLRVFLRDMPKGGDLHNHASGTPYAEEYLAWAAERDYCVTAEPAMISEPPCDAATEEPARDLMYRNPALHERLVNALSVRELISGVDVGHSGHNQFFASFNKFFAIVTQEPVKTLASVKNLAAADNVSYVELMSNPGPIDRYFSTVDDPLWDDADLDGAWERFSPNIPALVDAAISEHEAVLAETEAFLGCGTEAAQPGCDVTVYFNTYGLRRFPHDQLFAQLALGFAMIEADPRYLGMSLVEPEDDPRAIENYDLHMRMIAFLNEKFPGAKVSLHAGELTLGLAPAYALRSHIKDAIEVAGSDRIGHGVDIAWEEDSRETLAHMAAEGIAVEINLVSNQVILGLSGPGHPLNLYLASGVPIVLSTDDQGVLRTDMTEQYERAALEHGLSYAGLKRAARNSLEYAFLPGESIWADEVGVLSDTCETLNAPACQTLAETSPKAALQLKLEEDFDAFEADILTWTLD